MEGVDEIPLLHLERFVNFLITPGIGKTFCASSIAIRTDAFFTRVSSSELILNYISEGAQMLLSFLKWPQNNNNHKITLFFVKLMPLEGCGIPLDDCADGGNKV